MSIEHSQIVQIVVKLIITKIGESQFSGAITFHYLIEKLIDVIKTKSIDSIHLFLNWKYEFASEKLTLNNNNNQS